MRFFLMISRYVLCGGPSKGYEKRTFSYTLRAFEDIVTSP